MTNEIYMIICLLSLSKISMVFNVLCVNDIQLRLDACKIHANVFDINPNSDKKTVKFSLTANCVISQNDIISASF